MSWGINLILILIATGAVAWGFRYAGQQLTSNKPLYRDMSFAVAFGYVFGVVICVGAILYYFQPIDKKGVQAAGVVFFRWAVHGFAGFVIAAYLFLLATDHLRSGGA